MITAVQEKKETGKKPAAAECWHECPTHAAMYPLWQRMSYADQIEVGVLWQHPVDAIAKIDSYVKDCPSCRAAKRAETRG